jgi:tetratricopeptide (TPR) repeat protein
MMPAPGSGRAVWAIVGACMVAALMLAVVQDFGARTLNQLLLHAPGVDKPLHFVQSLALFMVFRVVLVRAAVRAAVPAAAAMALAAACLDELQQQFAGGRSIEVADIGAGLAGIGFGWGLLVRPALPARATAAMAGALLLCGALTYSSYQRTHDYNRGLLAERAGRMDDAARAYLQAIQNGVRHPEVFNAAAWALTESGAGDLQQAVEFAERSLAMRPGHPDTLDTYGWALVRAGRPRDAVGALEAALTAKPDIYCIHYHLAMAYLGLGRQDDAVRHFRLQVEQNPETAEAMRAAAELSRLGHPSRGAE